jgi:hypothetical protein
MPGYFKDDRVLQVIVEDIEEWVGPAEVVGKDDEWWRELSDAMWNMIDVSIAVDIANDFRKRRMRERSAAG